jgi:hypothetical protein
MLSESSLVIDVIRTAANPARGRIHGGDREVRFGRDTGLGNCSVGVVMIWCHLTARAGKKVPQRP